MEIEEHVFVMVSRANGDRMRRPFGVLVKIMWIWGEISVIAPAGSRILFGEGIGTVLKIVLS